MILRVKIRVKKYMKNFLLLKLNKPRIKGAKMSKITRPLSDTQIAKAVVKPKEYKLFDGDNLILSIRPSGKKVFLFKYSVGGKFSTITIGEYPLISLSKAREIKQTYKAKLSQNQNLKENNDNINFKELLEQSMQIITQNINNEKMQKRVRRELFLATLNLHQKTVKNITQSDIMAVLIEFNSHNPSNTTKFYNRLKKVYDYALMYKEKFNITYNIINEIKLQNFIKRHKSEHLKAITNERDFKILAKLIYALDEKNSVNNALKLLLHLPLRVNNIRNLKWEYIDFKGATISIPRAEMKIKNGADFVLPLSNEVIRILNLQKAISKGEFVFTSGRKDGVVISANAVNKRLLALGFSGELKQSAHSFRSTIRTILSERFAEFKGEVSEVAFERFLDHNIGNAVFMAYNRAEYFKQLKIITAWWSEFVLRSLE